MKQITDLESKYHITFRIVNYIIILTFLYIILFFFTQKTHLTIFDLFLFTLLYVVVCSILSIVKNSTKSRSFQFDNVCGIAARRDRFRFIKQKYIGIIIAIGTGILVFFLYGITIGIIFFGAMIVGLCFDRSFIHRSTISNMHLWSKVIITSKIFVRTLIPLKKWRIPPNAVSVLRSVIFLLLTAVAFVTNNLLFLILGILLDLFLDVVDGILSRMYEERNIARKYMSLDGICDRSNETALFVFIFLTIGIDLIPLLFAILLLWNFFWLFYLHNKGSFYLREIFILSFLYAFMGSQLYSMIFWTALNIFLMIPWNRFILKNSRIT